MDTKRFIAPMGWFEMEYPASFAESEGCDDAFLFFDPDRWSGNLVVSCFRGKDAEYPTCCMREELTTRKGAREEVIGGRRMVCSTSRFIEDGREYEGHYYVMGQEDLVFYVSFFCFPDASLEPVLLALRSLRARRAHQKYPPEIIPVRLKEIREIDEAFERIQNKVKECFSKDFRGEVEDIALMQRLIDEDRLSASKREPWMALALTLASILCNQYEGFEWRTLVDGEREAPVLERLATGGIMDPLHLVRSLRSGNIPVSLETVFAEMAEGGREA